MNVGDEAAAATAGGESEVAVFITVGVIWLACFCWLGVIGWARHRRKEREAYYLFETEKRLLDSDEAGAARILRLRREEERNRWLRRREGLKLGGLLTSALGVSVPIGLQFIDTGELSLAGAGSIPLLIGLALLAYAYVLYPDFIAMTGDIATSPSADRKDDLND